jgi:uncharacterized membrane protein YgaE (UPF0421/DUF939 family)
LWPILQTAVAASAAWFIAGVLLPDGRPSFASIAAVICLGVTHGQRGQRALQLVGGVVLGICVASALATLIGAGPLQIGLMVLLAMTAAVLLGGGELLTAEAAVSAILLVSLDPGASDGFSATRILEALIGGGVSLAVTSLLFPADPMLQVSRAAQAVFGGLGGTLERLAGALEAGDANAASAALASARALDADVVAFGESLRNGLETARLAPRRRASLAELERYGASFAQVDFAVRDTRVLCRHAVRLSRSGEPVAGEPVRELARAVWALAAAYERPDQADAARAHALRAGALAGGTALDVSGQVRSTAVDLRRAADIIGQADEPKVEAPTEELLPALA